MNKIFRIHGRRRKREWLVEVVERKGKIVIKIFRVVSNRQC